MRTKTEFRTRWLIKSQPFSALQASMLLLLLCLAADNGRAQNYGVLHHFAGSDGDEPSRLILSGATLYGSAKLGGLNNCGTIFKLSTNGSDFSVLKHFAGADGAEPSGDLLLSGETLYGTTFHGGISNRGTIFKLNTDGSGFTVLKEFTGSDRGLAGGLVLSDTTLYGTTFYGGISNRGTIFRLNTDGTGFTVIKEFTDPMEGGPGAVDGCLPGGRLALSGTTLYGVTAMGGVSGAGGVFVISTDGSGYTVLKQGDGTDAGHFNWGVILSGTTLYGFSPSPSLGKIFRMNTDGSGFTILGYVLSFNLDALWNLVWADSRLYGTGHQHEPSSDVVFMLGAEGSPFTTLKQFNTFEVPSSLVVAGPALYGVTASGGNANRGTVFGMSLPLPSVLQPPQSQTAEVGSSVEFFTQADGSQPLAYHWVFNDTNVLSGGGDAILRLTNVQPAQAGGYTVVVTNLFGAATTSPAMLNVIAPVERRSVPGINVTGEAGISLTLDYGEAVGTTTAWLPLATETLTNPPQYFFDLSEPVPPQRFYRAWQFGTPGVAPALGIHMIPALTLTGSVGSKLQVDGINQIGPTDAWFTLDTVTLTNTSQLYFDVSVIGQPLRLWRIVPVP